MFWLLMRLGSPFHLAWSSKLNARHDWLHRLLPMIYVSLYLENDDKYVNFDHLQKH